MKYCSECGKELKEGAELCPNCGFTINGLTQETGPKTKFCSRCGTEITNEMDFCPKCGRSLKTRWLVEPKYKNALQIVAKVLMILVCVRAGIFALYSLLNALSIPNLEKSLGVLLKIVDLYDVVEFVDWLGINYRFIFSISAITHVVSLLWLIPMTVHYFKSVAKQQPVSLAFKICTIIFASPVAGVLMLLSDGKINQ